MAVQRLEPKQLYSVAELENMPCKSTKELPPIDEIVGQSVDMCGSVDKRGTIKEAWSFAWISTFI